MYFYEGACSAQGPRAHRSFERFAIVNAYLFARYQLNNLVFFVIANDAFHTGEFTYSARRELRITTGDRRLAVRIVTMKLANHFAAGLGSFLGNGTSIEDKMIGVFWTVYYFVSRSIELASHGIDLALIKTTADHLQVHFHALASSSPVDHGL